MSRNTGKRISEAEFRRLWADQSITVAEIGKLLGIGQTAVSSRAKTRGLPPRPKRGAVPVCDAAEMTRLWTRGVAITGIAAAMGCDERTVRNTRTRLGLPGRGHGKWKGTLSIADYRAMQLRDAMAASALETAQALIDSEMVEHRQGARWMTGRAA